MKKSGRSRYLLAGGAAVILILAALSYNDGSGEEPVCDPGFHLENGICVIDQPPITCPTGYTLNVEYCQPVLPPRDTTWLLKTEQRTLDRDPTSLKFNVWSYIREGFVGTTRVHIVLTELETNTEVSHEYRNRTFSGPAGDTGYLNNYFTISPLKQCTTYNVFTYLTNAEETISYSEIEHDYNRTSCPATASIFSWLFSVFG